MVQRDPSPRGDKNGADINLALDALEMAFTHDHINAFAIVSGDSDFIALVNKLKQYDKRDLRGRRPGVHQHHPAEELPRIHQLRIAADGDRQAGPARHAAPQLHGQPQQSAPPQQRQGIAANRRPPPLDLALAMPLVERALQVLERREVRPQLGLLKSTMLQLDSTFSEKAYGVGLVHRFRREAASKADMVNVTGGEGRYMIKRKGDRPSRRRPAAKPEEGLPILRDVLETHRLEMDDGCTADDLAAWVEGRAAQLRLEEVRLPGIQRVAEFRAGQIAGARRTA